MSVHPAKTQISLGICPVWSVRCLHEEILGPELHIERTAKTQTGQMPRLIWVRWVHTHFVGLRKGYYHLGNQWRLKLVCASVQSFQNVRCSLTQYREPKKAFDKAPPLWEVRGSRPTAAVLCPWARHFTPRKYWLITQEAMAPSRHDWKIVDWDVKPQHNQPTNHLFDPSV